MGRRIKNLVENAQIINFQSNKVQSKTRFANPRPRNTNQKLYLEKLQNTAKNIIIAVGDAGTGKTLLATQYGIKLLQDKMYNRIIITRPAVSVEEELGYLPGDIRQKLEPWIQPVLDIFEEYYHPKTIIDMIENKIIDIVPFAVMRGRSFNNAYIIADEVQNCTKNQMMTLLTRIGYNSKMILTGDLSQADRGTDNGLYDFLQRFKPRCTDTSLIDYIEFTSRDIERHPVVEEIISIYNS